MGVIFKNNVMYGAGDIEISPVCYSEEEREIGCWTDGKPLYQTTIHTGALTKDGNWHNVAHNISNIDKIILCTGIVYTADGESFLMPNYRPTYSMGICLGATNTDIEYIQNWLDTSPDSYVTLQYTKTTDTPGSGIWTPSGVPAVHYSENEQVVGIDTDGSTVYEITYVGDMNIPIQTWGGTGIYISGNLISVDGYITRDGEPIPIGNFGTTIASTWILRDGEIKVQMTEYNTGEIYRLKRMTIRYTKTTS